MRRFYRLVETDPPTREHFMSYFEIGRVPKNASPRLLEVYKGVSVWETEDQARALAARRREPPAYIAEVALPEGVRAVRQGLSEGHHNVYASPDDLLGWVVRVVPVRLNSGREGR